MSRLALMAALLLSGCMSFGVLDEELPKYVGKPISNLVERLGYPNAEQTIMGQKAYIWSTTMQTESVVPSYTTGYVGTRPIALTTYSTESSTMSCTLRVFVTRTDYIMSSGYEGNNGACFRYSSQLKR